MAIDFTALPLRIEVLTTARGNIFAWGEATNVFQATTRLHAVGSCHGVGFRAQYTPTDSRVIVTEEFRGSFYFRHWNSDLRRDVLSASDFEPGDKLIGQYETHFPYHTLGLEVTPICLSYQLWCSMRDAERLDVGLAFKQLSIG